MSNHFGEDEGRGFALQLGLAFVLVVAAAAGTARFRDLARPLNTATVWVFVPDLKPLHLVIPIPAVVQSVLAVEPASTVPLCNTDDCAKSYLSFRAADCTFQPFEGPRRLCKK